MAVVQRLQRGSRISSVYTVKNLPSLASLDSAFQLQEYISLLIRLDPHDVERIVAVPGKSSVKDQDASEEKEVEKDGKGEVTVDEACWIYEQLRRLAQDLSHPLITVLQQECTRATCPEMKAGEWLYLCVAHGNDGAMEQCCAIDYIIHTLDSATALLNSPRAFPSRISIPQTSHRHFSSLARRLGRIFAHAYFHHRDAFAQAEAESSLYARFLALTARFALVPAEFLVIPPRLGEDDGEDGGGSSGDEHPVLLLPPAPEPVEPAADGAELLPPGYGGASPGGYVDSPRRAGRSRTDTMVFSEASAVAEELARAHSDDAEAAGELGAVDPVAESVLRANEDEAAHVEEPEALPSREDALHDDPAEADAVDAPAPPSGLADDTPSSESALHDGSATESAPTMSAITADVSAPTAASDRVGPGGIGPQGLIILAPPAPACETLADGTELSIEPPLDAPEEDGEPIEPHGPESPFESDADAAAQEDDDDEDVDMEDAEGGAPVAKGAVEEPLPSGSAPVPADVEAPAGDASALGKPTDEAAKDSVPPADEDATDVPDMKPSGLDAAVVAAEAAPEPTEEVSPTPADKPEEASQPAPAKTEDVDKPSGLDAAVADDKEAKSPA